MEVFGAIRAAVAQTSDAAVMTGSTMKKRAVLVDHEVRRDRRRELHQVHVLLCVVARQHAHLPNQPSLITSVLDAVVPHTRSSARRAARRYSACGELGGRQRDDVAIGRAQRPRRLELRRRPRLDRCG